MMQRQIAAARRMARKAARTIAVAALLAIFATPASAQRKVNEQFGVAPDGFIRVQNIAGSVKIIGWDRDAIAISGTVHDTPTERFSIQRNDDGVDVGLWDTSVERAEPSHIELRVPARSRVWVRTGSSSISVVQVTGSLDLNSVGGDIVVEGSPSELFAESMTGRIRLDVNTAVARAKTVTGSIFAVGTISSATLTSVSGNVLLENASVQQGTFESVDGELRFVGVPRRDGMLSFVTHGGAVEFLLPASSNALFNVSTYEGSLHNEFHVPVRTTQSKIKGGQQTFVLGDGRSAINVRTFRGRVVVRSR